MMVRYLFRGIVRETGKTVEGHVEAAHSEAAYEILGDNGIVTESLREDPKPLNMSPSAGPFPQFADALESALDSSSSQVPFDDLAEKYRGKNVWVIDRNKIRNRVAQVVDQALAASEANLEGGNTARQRVADAISGLFNDTRNIATERNSESIAGMRVTGGNGAAGGSGLSGLAAMSGDVLEQQIGRLAEVVQQAEGLIAAMASALRNMGSGAVKPRREMATQTTGPQQNEVLLEIFKSNLDLRRNMAEAPSQPPVEAA
jgi:hypothetical protein